MDAEPEVAVETVVAQFPSYYIEAQATGDDIKRVRKSWQLIIEDNGTEYQSQKSAIQWSSCWAWFYSIFYERFFEIAPEVQPLFKKDIAAQGKALVGMISTMLGLFNNIHSHSETEKTTLDNLAKRHVGYGVKCSYYGTFGEVLFWALKKVLGAEFNEETERSWLLMFCHMLKTVLPAAAIAENKHLQEGKQKHSR